MAKKQASTANRQDSSSAISARKPAASSRGTQRRATVLRFRLPSDEWAQAHQSVAWATEAQQALMRFVPPRRPSRAPQAPTLEALVENAEWTAGHAIKAVRRELRKFGGRYATTDENLAIQVRLSDSLRWLLDWQRYLATFAGPPATVYVLADYRKAGAG